MIYPIISSYYNEKRYETVINNYNSTINDSELRLFEAEEYNTEITFFF